MIAVTARGLLAAALLLTMGVAWWWALSTTVFGPVPAGAGPTAARPLAGADDTPQVRLDRLRRVGPLPDDRGGRDPFGGAAGWAGAGEPSGADAAEGLDAVALPVATAPALPRLELIGVGALTEDGAERRVAIFAGDRGIAHGKAGDVVAQIYRVERVGADAVDLRLLSDGRLLTLRLR